MSYEPTNETPHGVKPYTNRDAAFEEFMKGVGGWSDASEGDQREAFNAGWAARKKVEYIAADEKFNGMLG